MQRTITATRVRRHSKLLIWIQSVDLMTLNSMMLERRTTNAVPAWRSSPPSSCRATLTRSSCVSPSATAFPSFFIPHSALYHGKPSIYSLVLHWRPQIHTPHAPFTRHCRKARFPGHRCDSLILGFGDAKISFVEFDAATRDLVTTGMYCLDHKLRTVRRVCVCTMRQPVSGWVGARQKQKCSSHSETHIFTFNLLLRGFNSNAGPSL